MTVHCRIDLRARHQNKPAMLVGQPTGGNQRGINGGALFLLRLPHTTIEMDLPLIGFNPSVACPDAGLQPDVLVELRVADIARGIDTELGALKILLRGARKRTKLRQ